MAGAVRISIAGDERLAKKFRDLDLYLTDLRKPLSKSGDLLLGKYEENFKTEGATLRKNWKQLSPRTLAEKARLGYGSKGILERTGKLRRGFEKKVKRFSVTVFNKVPYYKYHQVGGTILPQRVMISATEEMKQDIIEILRRGLDKILQR